MHVAIIGAGWAGLAAAVELLEQGQAVSLFEAGRVAGGRARSVQWQGHTLDNGQHILLGAYRDTLSLMRKLGADPTHCFTRLPLRITDPSGFSLRLPLLPAPLNLAWGLMTARGISLTEKLKAALWMQSIKWRGFRLPAHRAEQTVAQWLDAAGQTGKLRQHLWEPLCLAALNTPVHKASAQLFANVLRDSLGSPRRADTDLLLPTRPFGELLPEPALGWLAKRGAALHMGHRVTHCQAHPDHVTVDEQRFDAMILAVAPHHLNRLWPAASPPTHHEPSATVYLQYPGAPRLPFPLFNLNDRIGQWLVDRGQGLLACVISGQGEWEKLDDQQLASALIHAIAPLPGFTDITPRWQKVIREKRATFSAEPGLQRCEPHPHPRVSIAGDHTWAEYPATLEGAVRSGQRAARQLLA